MLALLVFGPEKLPEMGRKLGKGIAQMKRMASDVKSEFDLSAQDNEVAEPPVAAVSPAASKVDERIEAEDETRTAAAV